MDLGFEGGFTVLKESVNQKINLEWKIHSVNSRWVRLPKTRFKTVLQMIYVQMLNRHGVIILEKEGFLYRTIVLIVLWI